MNSCWKMKIQVQILVLGGVAVCLCIFDVVVNRACVDVIIGIILTLQLPLTILTCIIDLNKVNVKKKRRRR